MVLSVTPSVPALSSGGGAGKAGQPERAGGGPRRFFGQHQPGGCQQPRPCGIAGFICRAVLDEGFKDQVQHLPAQRGIRFMAQRIKPFEAQNVACVNRVRIADQYADPGQRHRLRHSRRPAAENL